MRAHNLSWKIIVPALAVAAMLLPAAIVYGHPDALGTRFVSPATGTDTGDCDDNHHPCRTLVYALTQVAPGNAIKLAIRWAKEVNGDRSASMTIEKVGSDGMRLTTVDTDPRTGKNVVTSQINLRRDLP